MYRMDDVESGICPRLIKNAKKAVESAFFLSINPIISILRMMIAASTQCKASITLDQTYCTKKNLINQQKDSMRTAFLLV